MKHPTVWRSGALVFLGAFLCYGGAALWSPEFGNGNDSCTYLTTARTLAERGTLTQDYLWHYHLNSPAIVHSVIDRRPLAVVLLAALMRLEPLVPNAHRLLYPALGAAVVALTYGLGCRFSGRRAVGLLAAALIFLNDYQWSYALGTVPEILTQFLILLMLLALFRAHASPAPMLPLALAGTAAGLCWLTRNPELITIIPVLVTGIVIARSSRRRAALLGLGLALGLFWLINFPWQWWTGHQPLDHARYRNAMFYATTITEFYGPPAELGPGRFFSQPLPRLIRNYLQAGYQLLDHLRLYYSFPLVAGLALGIAAQPRHPLLCLALLQFIPSFLAHWLFVSGEGRAYLGDYFYLLPIAAVFAAAGLASGFDRVAPARGRRAFVILALGLLVFYLGGTTAASLIRENRFARVQGDTYRALARWCAAVPEPQPAFMVPEPPTFNWYTRRPAILLPRDASLDELLELAQRYQVGYLIHDGWYKSAADLYAGTAANPRFQPVLKIPAADSAKGYLAVFKIDPRGRPEPSAPTRR